MSDLCHIFSSTELEFFLLCDRRTRRSCRCPFTLVDAPTGFKRRTAQALNSRFQGYTNAPDSDSQSDSDTQIQLQILSRIGTRIRNPVAVAGIEMLLEPLTLRAVVNATDAS